MLLVRNKLNLSIATDISFEVTNMKYDLEHMQTCYTCMLQAGILKEQLLTYLVANSRLVLVLNASSV